MAGSRVEIHDSFEPLEREWDELADAAAAGPFARPGWYRAWWRAFGSGRLELLTLSRAGRLEAVLPLSRGRSRRCSLTNWHTPELRVPASGERARAALFRALLEGSRVPVSLRFLTEGQPDAETLRREAAACGTPLLVRTVERSPYVPIAGAFEDYLAALPRRRRSELRRRQRRLEERGEVTYEVADGGTRLLDLLSEGFVVEGSGWKSEQGTAIVSRPETLRFYNDVAGWAAARGSLRLSFLRLEGQPLAFHLLIEENGVAYQLKGGYDPAHRAHSPGALHIRHTLEWAFDKGLHGYEFLGEDEDFKLDWTATTRDRLAVEVFPRSVAGYVGRAASEYGRPAAKRARDLVRR